jgi:streptogramin lyase
MRVIGKVIGAWIVASIAVSVAQGEEAHGVDGLLGEWTGNAVFVLPLGKTEQVHRFVFTEASDGFVRGEHSWTIPAKNLHSHDGRAPTYEATEPFLGVVDQDGAVWLVESGDLTMFRLTRVDPDRIAFIGLEGGPNALVGRGELKRD